MSLHGSEFYNSNTGVIYERIDSHNIPYNFMDIFMSFDHPSLSSPPHWHRSMEFILPFNSDISVVINGNPKTILQNHIVLIPPMAVHSTSAISEGDIFHSLVLQIRYSFLQKYLLKCTYFHYDYHLSDEELNRIKHIILAMYEAYTNSAYHNSLTMQGFLLILIDVLVQHQKQDLSVTDQTGMYTDTIISFVFSYVEKHYAEPLMVDEIANSSGYSYGYLERIFKEATNMSLTHYINDVRLEKAASELRQSDARILDIAMHCGFSSLQNFYKYFKEKYSVSPNAYRKMVRK